MQNMAAKRWGPAVRASTVNQVTDFCGILLLGPGTNWPQRVQDNIPGHWVGEDWKPVPASYKGPEVTKDHTWVQKPACNDA